jgi:general L-amino acid transport system substrate-binding protein
MNKVKSIVAAGTAIFVMQAATSPSAIAQERTNTLQQVKDRGYLSCVIGNSFPGFYSLNKDGEWQGMDKVLPPSKVAKAICCRKA